MESYRKVGEFKELEEWWTQKIERLRQISQWMTSKMRGESEQLYSVFAGVKHMLLWEIHYSKTQRDNL